MDSGNFATFILSTGRCGTQWIATSVADVFGDLIDVEHEPLENEYEPRKMLGVTSESFSAQRFTVISSHLNSIEHILESRPYLECGHPCWSTLPLIAERFRGRIKIIHLTRHPVTTCCSWLTHTAYQQPILPHVSQRILLSPFDEGVKFIEYQAEWDELSAFEKCIYYWSEVNAFGIDRESKLAAPWLHLRYEDIFQGNGIERLLEFLELPKRKNIFETKTRLVDKFRYLSTEWDDLQIINKHPRAIAISKGLGYDVNDYDETALLARYFGGDSR